MSKHLRLRLRYARARRRGQSPLRHGAEAAGWFGSSAVGAPSRVFTAGWREFALFAAVYLLYDAARWAWAGNLSLARAHADQVIGLERSLHIAVEGSVQRALDSGVLSFVLSNIYLAAQAIVLPAALVWLYRNSPRVYWQLRGTVVITWLIATPIFALYPVAPPRLAGIGIKDVVSHQAVVALTGQSTLFYNPYAAVPSLHVGLAFAIGVAAAAALSRPWARALALLWGPLVTLAVIATGNHYLFDAATGLLVAAVAFATTRMVNSARVKLQFAGRADGSRSTGTSAPVVARPNRPAITARRRVPETAAGGCQP
jgi:PAP2 superfamily